MGFLVKVWDLPTRLFHWSLVLLLGASVCSVWVFDNLVWHANCGYALTVLCVFRVLWGVVGGRWSRFTHMVFRWQTLLSYVRQPSVWPHAGHNPLGGLSVLAMLLFMVLQIVSGMSSDDDAGFSGPLTVFLSNTWVSRATLYHAEVGKWVLLCLVVLHLFAILYHEWVHKRRLVRPMLNGFQSLPHEAPASEDRWTHRLLALCLFAVCVVLVYAGLQWAQGLAIG
jgi:cytochrome b